MSMQLQGVRRDAHLARHIAINDQKYGTTFHLKNSITRVLGEILDKKQMKFQGRNLLLLFKEFFRKLLLKQN